MKANCGTPSRLAFAASAALSLLLGACVAPVQAPVAAPPPARPLPPPLPAPVVPSDWHDLPATPGVWQWRREGSLSIARFGDSPRQALFSLACDTRAGTIAMARGDAAGSAASMAILTTSLSRELAVRPDGHGAVTATLPARDPLLDAMAFSRGRFAVKVAGVSTLYLPSWPEVARVVEDCR